MEGAGTVSKAVVQIFGEEYTISGEEAPEYVRKIARYVDLKMRDVALENELYSKTTVAILAAMIIADELFREREEKNLLAQKADENITRLSELLEQQVRMFTDG